MSVAPTATRQAAPPISQPHRTETPSQDDSQASHPRRHEPARRNRQATDDEILGIDIALEPPAPDSQLALDFDGVDASSDPKNANGDSGDPSSPDSAAAPESVRAALDANPELRRAWQDAQAYREMFATPEEAHAATALLADLDHMDALFFSRRPEDHAELARSVSQLDPAAFASLAQAMSQLAGSPAGARDSAPGAVQRDGQQQANQQNPAAPAIPRQQARHRRRPSFFMRPTPRRCRAFSTPSNRKWSGYYRKAYRKAPTTAWSVKSTANSIPRCVPTASSRSRCARRSDRER